MDDRISVKVATKMSSYALVYGKRPMLPIHFERSIPKLLQDFEYLDCEPLQIRLNQLLRLEEDNNKVYEAFQHR